MQIERMLGTKVFLELYVKAEPGWRDSRRFVDELDWRRQLEQRMLEQGIDESKRRETKPRTSQFDIEDIDRLLICAACKSKRALPILIAYH